MVVSVSFCISLSGVSLPIPPGQLGSRVPLTHDAGAVFYSPPSAVTRLRREMIQNRFETAMIFWALYWSIIGPVVFIAFCFVVYG